VTLNNKPLRLVCLVALAVVVGGCASSSDSKNREASENPALGPFTKDLGLQQTPWGQMRVVFALAAKSRTPPRYPPEAKWAGMGTEVTLEALIGTDGIPHDVRVFQSSGWDEFDQSAVECFYHWRFPAWIENGRTVAVVTRQVIVFRVVQ
jgi:TonB family protein